MDKKVSEILREKAFRFNKQFGQNFITDTNLLDAIVAESGIVAGDTVLEIGAGAGTLTAAIAKVAKKVVAYEIDNNLREVLSLTLAEFDNIDMQFGDFMKVDEEQLFALMQGEYRVVANLPYYITTPIIMSLLESNHPPKSISIMVQKEVAERITAKANTPDYGAITAVIDLVANASVTRIVGRQMFYPVPNVDSAVLRIDYIKDKFPDIDIPKTKKVIKSAFTMRRKTLVNNLAQTMSLTKERAAEILRELGLDERIRGEVLDTKQFIALARLI